VRNAIERPSGDQEGANERPGGPTTVRRAPPPLSATTIRPPAENARLREPGAQDGESWPRFLASSVTRPPRTTSSAMPFANTRVNAIREPSGAQTGHQSWKGRIRGDAADAGATSASTAASTTSRFTARSVVRPR
jgi:hypothetical protein